MNPTMAMSWRHEAACTGHDPDWWFSHNPDIQALAVEVCAGCPVARECLTDARRTNEKHGIRGGMLSGGRIPFRSPSYCHAKGCDRRHSSKGWCHVHYNRWRRTGGLELQEKPAYDGAGQILADVADEYGLTISDLVGRSRDARTVEARHAGMARLRALGLSTPQIGSLLGRDHSTVLSALRKADA